MTDTITQSPSAGATLERQEWKLLINGEQVDAAGGETFEVHNPATNQVIGRVAKAGKEDADRAVQAARAAFEGGKWPRTPASRRTSLLLKVAEIMRRRFDELARTETLNNGKAIAQSK